MNKLQSRVAKVLLLGCWTVYGASWAAEPASGHPVDHPMGSQIRLHEPVDAGARPALSSSIPGMDVSSWQGEVDWAAAYADGARFAYVKATEGTTYTNPYFAQQYNGSYEQGMVRGAYHFALPDRSSGAAQADYFLAHGGGWSADGRTLPGALDMEYNPYGATCYGLSQSGLAAWISDFVSAYYDAAGRYPTIYTSTSWWEQCVGDQGGFAAADPLWIARYSSSVGELPQPWVDYVFWQYADSGTFPGDQDLFQGSMLDLRRFAKHP